MAGSELEPAALPDLTAGPGRSGHQSRHKEARPGHKTTQTEKTHNSVAAADNGSADLADDAKQIVWVVLLRLRGDTGALATEAEDAWLNADFRDTASEWLLG